MIRVTLLVALVLAGGGSRAEPLAFYRADQYSVILMTEKCSGRRDGISRVAFKKPAGPAVGGCWWFNARDNPMVAWTGGRIQELAASHLRLAPAYEVAIAPMRPGWTEWKTPPKRAADRLKLSRARDHQAWLAQARPCRSKSPACRGGVHAKVPAIRQALASR